MMSLLLLLTVTQARADQPCATFYSPADVVEAAMRLQGAEAVGGADESEAVERRALTLRLACVSEPLTPGDAAAVHLAITGRPLPARPAPAPGDARSGPPHPDGGVALVDGQAFAALPDKGPALVQAFDDEGHVVYTRWLDPAEVAGVRRGTGTPLPTSPMVPRLPPVPLSRGEIGRLIGSGALVVASGVLFGVAADARADWYALDPSPVETVQELERLRVRTNVTQGAGLACASLGAAGLLSVAVRVPF